MDVQRRLDRIECKVTQYFNVGEQVMPVLEVTRRTASILPRVVTLFQDPINVSGIIVFLPTLCFCQVEVGPVNELFVQE